MSDYRVADGHDVALGSLNVLDPQPASTGVQVTERVSALTGAIHEQGLYIELVWEMRQNTTDLQSILTSFGVLSADTNEVTIYVPGPTGTYTRYNGLAIRPETGQDMRHRRYFWHDITILVRNLVAA